MIVKPDKFFFLSAILLVVLSPASAKILPSLLSKFTQLSPAEKVLARGSQSHLSKNFHDEAKAAAHEPIKISQGLVSPPPEGGPVDRNLGAAENYAAFDVNFETTEVKDVLAFVEYKMNEITSLVQECIDQEYATDVGASIEKIRHECVGSTYQIIFFNYNEGLKKMKEVLMEILKLKLQNLKEDYEDETNFFLDVLESLVSKDYTIPKSLELAKKASKYYVSPRYFDRLVALTNPEVQAFTVLHERLKEQRSKIQDQLRQKEANEEEYIDAIERKARMLKRKNDAARKMREVKSGNLPRQEAQRQQAHYLPPARLAAQSSYSPTPDDLADNEYLNKVENQMDNLGLYHDPALPDETSVREEQPAAFMPPRPAQDDFMVKKV